MKLNNWNHYLSVKVNTKVEVENVIVRAFRPKQSHLPIVRLLQSYLFRNVVLILILLLFSFSFANANSTNIALDSANAAYAKGDFNKAAEQYESIVNKGLESPELYFNLGNAYYKTNNVALAILNYERAKKLNPTDEDLIVNLKFANQKIEDKIDAAPQLFLVQWKNGLIGLLNEKAWSVLCILLVTLALFLFAIYIISYNRFLKQLGFFGGTIFIVSAFITLFIAQQKYLQAKNSNDAIITTAAVTVMGSPNEKGTKLFLLHEGTKVNISDKAGDWCEIKIANGNVGWVKSKEVTSI